uniref:Ig-like domain-containing protein n=1 Tax=Oncorhynchus mykiss TaxID=8022 RepID=A0A8K9VAP9_ONCMY
MKSYSSGSLGIILISLLLETETSHVVSPDPVVAVADDDVILPCSLLNFTKSAGLIVKWSRSNLKDPTGKDKVVHFYRDARDSNVDQDESYRGRTSLLKELKNGNVSLKLSRVKLSDEGNYMCYILVPEPNSLVHETVIQLIVVAVSNPVISINGTKGSGVVLKCEAKSWYPKPEMNWLDSERQVLPAGSAETHRDTEGLYIVRRHVTVNKNVTNTFTCRVQLQKFNFTRETEYNVPDEMFPTVPWVWIAVPVLIVCVCGLVVGFMWIKYQKLRKKIDVADQQIKELTDELDSSRIKSDQRIKELTDELGTREQELTEQLAKLKQERAALVSSVDNGCHRFSFSRTLSMSLSNVSIMCMTGLLKACCLCACAGMHVWVEISIRQSQKDCQSLSQENVCICQHRYV